MKAKSFLLCLILIIITCIIFTCLNIIEYNFENQNVKEYEKFNYNEENELIFYWAEWCGVCQKIKPIWEDSKKTINEKYPNLKIIEIECDDPKKCFMYKNSTKKLIEGVPTIILRNGKKDIEYVRDESNNILCNKESSDLINFLNLYLEK